jgi:hypothetical protein
VECSFKLVSQELIKIQKFYIFIFINKIYKMCPTNQVRDLNHSDWAIKQVKHMAHKVNREIKIEYTKKRI